MVRELYDVRADLYTQGFPSTPYETDGRDNSEHVLLCIAVEMLVYLSDANLEEALEAACILLPLPLAPDPFDGAVYRLSEYLAETVGDKDLQQQFGARYDAYLQRFSAGRALLGLSDLLLDPYLMGALEEALEDSRETGRDEGVAHGAIPSFAPSIPQSGYAPFANAGQNTPARAYLVQVRKLTDPRVAQFAIFPSTLFDITDGGDLGREDGRGRLYADLVLDFGDAHSRLESLVEPDDLALRIVFGGSSDFEAFAVADRTLFDVEVVPEERRLYFKLLVPNAWVAAGLPLTAIWPRVESLVLLSYVKDF